MSSPLRLACLAFAAASLAVPASAAEQREDRAVSGFHAIAMGVAMDFEVRQDGTESLSIEGDPETLSRIEIFVHDGTLDFRYKRGTHLSNHGRVRGSGAIKAGKLEAQRGDVSTSGSGNATVWAKQQLATAISGVGNVRYYGDPTLAQSVRGVGRVERVAANP